MKCFFLFLHEVLLITSGFALLPATNKPYVVSVNFRHVLQWEPGPGTPLGTEYLIFREKGKRRKHLKSTNETSFKLKLDNKKSYTFAVQASYNQTSSPLSTTNLFTPFRDTVIGSPELLVAGCGTCLQVNITLPKADNQSKIDDLQSFYDCTFRVLLRKENKGKVEVQETREKNLILRNLEKGISYCVKVHTKIRTNKNTEPSDWHCSLTSPTEPRQGPLILGIVTALCVLVVFLMMIMFCLCYTNSLCKLKVTRPRAIMMVRLQNAILIPDKTVTHKIAVDLGTSTQRNSNNSTATVDSNSEEDYDEEEDDVINLYLEREAEQSLYERSKQHSAPDDSGCSVVRLPVVAEFDQDYDEAEGAEMRNNFDQTGVLVQARSCEEDEEIKVDFQDISEDVNLFSVIVASLAEGSGYQEEDTEESLTNFLKVSSLQPLSQQVTETETETSQMLRIHPGREFDDGYDRKNMA